MNYNKLSIIIPVYNEVETIQEALKRVEEARLNFPLEKEIIIVDDGSTDGTRGILDNLADKYRIIYHQKNLGKGKSIKDGLLISTGDIIIIQDADLEYEPQEYNRLLAPILTNKADVVYGSRLMTHQPHRVLFYWHYLANKFLTTLSNIFTNLNLTDMETCYKVFNRRVIDQIAPKLKSKRFGIEPEITARIAKHRFKIYEIGISYHGRTYQEGKKIKWRDGLAAVWHIIKYNLFG